MNQTENPLEQLKDIQVPQTLDSFGLAPGWWVLIGLMLFGIGYLFFQWYRKQRALRILTPAINELDTIGKLPPSGQSLAELSALLKRVCLLYFPKNQIAGLSGQQWIEFLNNKIGQPIFTSEQQHALTQLAYQAKPLLEQSLWQELVKNSRIAVDSIIRNAVKEQLK